MPIITMWAPTSDDLLLGVVEAAPQRLLEGGQPALAQLGRRDVDLEVELAELGLTKSGSAIASSASVFFSAGSPCVVDEVELDLEAGHRVVGVEPGLAQHPCEHVEAAADLLAVPRAVRPRELLCVDLFAHGRRLGSIGVGASLDAGSGPRGASPPSRRRHGRDQEVGHQRRQRVARLGLRAGRRRTTRARRRRPPRRRTPSTAAAWATRSSGARRTSAPQNPTWSRAVVRLSRPRPRRGPAAATQRHEQPGGHVGRRRRRAATHCRATVAGTQSGPAPRTRRVAHRPRRPRPTAVGSGGAWPPGRPGSRGAPGRPHRLDDERVAGDVVGHPGGRGRAPGRSSGNHHPPSTRSASTTSSPRPARPAQPAHRGGEASSSV